MQKVITDTYELEMALRDLSAGQREALRHYRMYEQNFKMNDKLLELMDIIITQEIVLDYAVTAKECWDAINFFNKARWEMHKAMFS